MAPSPPRLRILSVGGNSVSAFLSWRLQATNACDVTLVWKSGFEPVSQYGISFKSKLFGNERFKPLHVVRAPEDAAHRKNGFDYVLLCVKALPDVYDLAAVIESVVTPQHTCILVNTTHSLGVEAHLEERFPTNVVLSLVSGAQITQLGASEFEHVGSTDVWVGPANRNDSIPATIQNDMAEALAMTLNSGQVDCQVSPNIRQQQFERMVGPIAFHPLSVLFENPNHAELIEKVGVRTMVSDIIDEVLAIATAQSCQFPPTFKEITMQEMLKPTDTNSIMYQDFTARRPMEIETYLGSPIKLAQAAGIRVPRIETLYAILHNLNTLNQNRPQSTTPPLPNPSNPPPPRTSSVGYGGPRPPMNGMPNGAPRGRGGHYGGPPPGPRRGQSMGNGYPPRGPPNGHGRPPPPHLARRPSFDNNDLEEFSHVVLYDDIPEGDVAGGYGMGNTSPTEISLRERELALKQREIQLREQELHMRRGGRGRGAHRPTFDEDDDEDEYFDPLNPRGPVPQIDPDNFDMMSVTSRRNRKAPSARDLRANPEMMGMRGPASRSASFLGPRGPPGRNRSSQQMMQDVPLPHESILHNPMAGYASNRYGTVDRKNMADESRHNSLTRERLAEFAGAGMNGAQSGPYPTPRRTSMSPGDPFGGPGPNGRRVSGRPSPPGGYPGGPMGPPNGVRPPGPVQQPVPRHPPGQGNAVSPQQVEQQAGVSNKPLPPLNKGPAHAVRSLTGSASASAGSGESAEISAHSSQSSFAPRPPIGVR